jgi:sugar phosphate isomerase/epimerase
MATLLGHTLGTPDLSPIEALDLFARSGLDGAEFIWLDDYRGAIPESDDGTVAAQVKAHAEDLGLCIGALTPYVTELNSLDDTVYAREVRRLEQAIAVARSLDCNRIRVYAGKLLGDEPASDIPRLRQRLVDALGRLGPVAEDRGVLLCIENHFGTMAVSAAETVDIVEEVASGGVGILYDQANLTFMHREDYEQAIALQAPWIGHVHVKDLEFIHADKVLKTTAVASIDKSERVHHSRMVGDGILDWEAITTALRLAGYDGTYSLEYEYRWNPEDLPVPEVGFPESARRLRACFSGQAAQAR